MGLLAKFKGRQELAVVALPPGREVEVKGEASYQEAFLRICGGRCEDGYQKPVTAVLRPEPTNRYDRNAVRVFVEGHLVGHLAKAEAATYSPVLQAMEKKIGAVGACDATIVGGWDRGGDDIGHFGIWLKLASPDAVAAL